MSFQRFELEENVHKGIADMEFEAPTEVQEQAIPLILNGHDLIVQSKTGSGKTAAFVIPILHALDDEKALVVTPTRELAIQVAQDFTDLGKHSDVHATAVYGGESIQRQVERLPGRQVIVATPGRLLDLNRRGIVKLAEFDIVVMDEADRMLDMGFEDQITAIMDAVPSERQTLLFSATMPDMIQKISSKYLREPEKILLSQDRPDLSTIEQVYYPCSRNNKLTKLMYALKDADINSSIIFCATKKSVDWLTGILKANGFDAIAMHGDKSQSRRLKTLDKLREGEVPIMVATDVAARGIDIEHISHVINFDVPREAEMYIHRVGRTGRIGRQGKAITLVTPEDGRYWDQIQRKLPERVDQVRVPEDFEYKVRFPRKKKRGRRGRR